MRGCMRLLAVLVAMLFVITAVVALFVVNLIAVVADREAIKALTAGLDDLVIEAAPALIAESLAEEARRQGLPAVDLDQELMAAAVEEVIPPDWLQAQSEAVIDVVYDYLETGELAQTAVEIELQPLLDRFQGEAGRELIALVVESLPVCSDPAQVVRIDPQDPQIPDCLPADTDIPQVVEEVHRTMVRTIEENPEIVAETKSVIVPLFTAEDNGSFSVSERQELRRAQQLFQRAKRWAWTLWLVPAACLGLLLVLAVRSLAEWGHWWGWPLIITALFVLFVAIVTPATLSLFVQNAVFPGELQQLTGPLRAYTQDFIRRLTTTWLNRIYLQAGLMLIFGIGLVIMAVLAGLLRQEKEISTAGG